MRLRVVFRSRRIFLVSTHPGGLIGMHEGGSSMNSWVLVVVNGGLVGMQRQGESFFMIRRRESHLGYYHSICDSNRGDHSTKDFIHPANSPLIKNRRRKKKNEI
mmetsp:Transcript_27282/g.33040  ORF Transcript_27282/g.33040 Transcript_27282/m.33040 type:complete len:104 (-) Transcript_27282:181-492(-)